MPPAHPDNNFYLGLNGHWGPARDGFLGISAGNGSMVTARIEFTSGPVSLVGGLFNYSPTFPPIILRALDENLSVIEEYVIDVEAPISTPGQFDAGAFRGIMRDQDEIFAIEITTPFVVIDDIRFSRVIPEPSTLSASALAILVALFNWRANRYRRR
jgi:hypothetical protein